MAKANSTKAASAKPKLANRGKSDVGQRRSPPSLAELASLFPLSPRTELRVLHKLFVEAAHDSDNAPINTNEGKTTVPETGVSFSAGIAAGARRCFSAETRVVAILDDLFGEIYALDDFALRYAQTPFTRSTMREASTALAKRIRKGLDDCRTILEATHEANNEFRMAEAALCGMEDLLSDTDDMSESEFSKIIPNATIGAAMRTSVIETAQAIERAQLACGASFGTAGYLERPTDDRCAVPTEEEVPHG